jgi:hypothetical protein
MEDVYWAMLISFVGFFVLAYILLRPFYRLLKSEEKASLEWTPDRLRRPPGGDGAIAPAEPLAPGQKESI